ncbi:unnamed protein product [Symbiodinium sp. CCMP2592]|nr:unnamed protein product [Symbiodinium sp. CCMP2592]
MDASVPAPAGAAKEKKRTRPIGSGGSAAYKRDLKALRDAAHPEGEEQDSGCARAAKARLCRARAREAAQVAQDGQPEGSVSELWRYRSLGSELQKRLMLCVMASRKPTAPEVDPDAASFVKRHLMQLQPGLSFTAEASAVDNERRNLKSMLLRTGAAVYWGASMMFGNLASSILASGAKVVMLVKKRRYDETPLRVRQKSSEEGTAVPTKLLQTELSFGVLLQKNEQYMFARTTLPTTLSSFDACTGETLKACQLNLESSVPELRRLAREAAFKVQLVMTDRAGPNIKCEKSMQLEDASFVKAHGFCKIHKLAQQQTQCCNLVDGHISGIIALAVAMQMAGATSKMRDALSSVLRKRVDICIGDPPDNADNDAYREQVFDMCLSDCSGSGDEGAKVNRVRRRQRLVLEHYFRGSNLRGTRILFFWPSGPVPDENQIFAELDEHLVPALIPHRCPVFPRSRWTGGDLALDWVLLLGLCFLEPGRPHEAGVGATATDDDWDAFCLNLVSGVHSGERGPESEQAVPPPAQQDASAGDPDAPELATAEMSWADFNAAMKRKAAVFAQQCPSAALAICRPVMSCNLQLLYHALKVSGDTWDMQQSLEGSNVRRYRILDEYSGKASHDFFDSLRSIFTSVPSALPPRALAKSLRTLLFRCAARAGACHHQLLERFRRGFPTQLFGALLGNDAVLNVSKCLLDELSSQFRDRFEDSGLQSSEAQSFLHALATMYDLDIAGIEARHASIRRHVKLFSNQTSGADLPMVSAKFVVQQQALQNLRWSTHKARTSSRAGRIGMARRPVKKEGQATKQKRAKQPGGSWNAFQHIKSLGVRRRFSGDYVKQLSAEYWQLSSDDRSYYDELGRLARIAGEEGFKPFPKTSALPAAARVAQAGQLQPVQHPPGELAPSPPGSDVKQALLALDAQLRAECSNRTQALAQLQDSVSEMSHFAPQPEELSALATECCQMQDSDKEHFKWFGGSLPSVHWVPPTIPFACVACRDQGRRGQGLETGLKTALHEAWEQHHQMTYEKEEPRIRDSDFRELFEPSICHRLAMCVCSGRGQQAFRLHTKTIKLLRPLLVAKSRKRDATTKQFLEPKPVKPEARFLAESGHLVLCFRKKEAEPERAEPEPDWEEYVASLLQNPANVSSHATAASAPIALPPGGICDDEVWFHVGYMNFRTYEASGLCLERADLDLQDADLDILTLSILQELTFRTLLEAMCEHIDYNCSWSLQLYEVLSLPTSVQLEDMVPDQIDVRALKNCHEILVWQGADREAANAAEAEAAAEARSRHKHRNRPEGEQQQRQSIRPAMPALRRRQTSAAAPGDMPDADVDMAAADPDEDFGGGVGPVEYHPPAASVDDYTDGEQDEDANTPAWLQRAFDLMDAEFANQELPFDDAAQATLGALFETLVVWNLSFLFAL